MASAYSSITSAGRSWRRWWQRRWIEPILKRAAPPQVVDDNAAVQALLARCPPRPIRYGYDADSLRRRGQDRARSLVKLLGPGAKDKRVLEVGSGDGMTGVALADAGVDVTLLDLEDWRDPRATHLRFIATDACAAFPFNDDAFNLCYSFNTFEHLREPSVTLREMLRILKPGGVVHLKFGPLYASAWGLHAYKTLPVPYAQWLFSDKRVERILSETGIHDLGRDREELQPLNRWPLAQFLELFKQSGCQIVDIGQTLDSSSLWIVRAYPSAFTGRGLTFDDLIVKTLRVTLVAPGKD